MKLRIVGLITVGLGIAGLAIGESTLFAQKAANPVIVIETDKGNIEIELQPKWAPKGGNSEGDRQALHSAACYND